MFRRELLRISPQQRDSWVDEVFGLAELPEDGGDLPAGCVPYLPSSVATLLGVIERANITARDVFVDVGCGLGRALALVHLLTGASAVGLEIQAGMVLEARRLAQRLGLERVSSVCGDAVQLVGNMTLGSVFFFYCPFSGARLASAVQALEPLARARPLRLCFVDTPPPELSWLAAEPVPFGDVEHIAIRWTKLHSELCVRAAVHNATSLAAL